MTVPVDHPAGEPAPFAIRVPGGVAELHATGLTVVRYPGVGQVDAYPHDTDEYRAKARELGYGDDVFLMSREHELLHAALLPRWLGLPHSPTMMGIAAHGAGAGAFWPGWRVEENAALAVQAMARVCGVSLVQLATKAGGME